MSAQPRRMYLDPTDDDARRLLQRGIEGPLLMLNLLRFREIAEYSGFPDLAPTEPISGSRCSRPRAKATAAIAINAARRRLPWAATRCGLAC